MFGTRWRLFRLSGIPIYLDASWLIILALLTLTTAQRYRLSFPDLPAGTIWIMGGVTAVAFFACIVLHELGHAVVARRGGMPVRGITLFLFGGVAELEGEPPSAGREFSMAVAGPLVSLVLGLGFWGLAEWGVRADWPVPVWAVLGYLAAINIIVLVFNLIPAFPLDGGRILRSALWAWTGNVRRATRWASAAGTAFAWVLIGLGVMSFFDGDWVGGVWLGLIGMFLMNAARGAYENVVLREVLRGEPVRRFMTPDPIVVPPGLDLQSWVDEFVYRHHRKAFPVAENGHLEGIITTQALARFPREEWPRHTVAEAMQGVDGLSVPPQEDALNALERMQRSGSSRLLVTEGDQLLGVISAADLMRFLQMKLELEPDEGGPGRPGATAGA